jgi:hypothetical protein
MYPINVIAGSVDLADQWLPGGDTTDKETLYRVPLSVSLGQKLPNGEIFDFPDKREVLISAAPGQLLILDEDVRVAADGTTLPVVSIKKTGSVGRIMYGPEAMTSENSVIIPHQPMSTDDEEDWYARFADVELIATTKPGALLNGPPLTPRGDLAVFVGTVVPRRTINGTEVLLLVSIRKVAYASTSAKPQSGGLDWAQVDKRHPVAFTLPQMGHAASRPIPFRLGVNHIIIGTGEIGKTTIALEKLAVEAKNAKMTVHFVGTDEPYQAYSDPDILFGSGGRSVVKHWMAGNCRPQTIEAIYDYVYRNGKEEEKHLVIVDGFRQLDDLDIPGYENRTLPYGRPSSTIPLLNSVSRTIHPKITGVFLWTTDDSKQGQEEATYRSLNSSSTNVLWMQQLGQFTAGRMRLDPDVFQRGLKSALVERLGLL